MSVSVTSCPFSVPYFFQQNMIPSHKMSYVRVIFIQLSTDLFLISGVTALISCSVTPKMTVSLLIYWFDKCSKSVLWLEWVLHFDCIEGVNFQFRSRWYIFCLTLLAIDWFTGWLRKWESSLTDWLLLRICHLLNSLNLPMFSWQTASIFLNEKPVAIDWLSDNVELLCIFSGTFDLLTDWLTDQLIINFDIFYHVRIGHTETNKMAYIMLTCVYIFGLPCERPLRCPMWNPVLTESLKFGWRTRAKNDGPSQDHRKF